ncbi:RraA family protein [Spiractinospora alimapuensis]|uniref:RraA family protein n=1 Tax=Spiractinospora alimapuensis TaxID=2820884 RepID=UPI001F387E9E|nr:RraA family protein [Spiractinospora alimapuensis]QVQ52647.1 RraA family protein [Spiractinospora alimapuensis]
MGVGNRVLARPKSTVPPDVIRRFRDAQTPTPNVVDVMARFGTLRGLHRISGRYLAGIAITVRTRPSDNLMVHRALDLAEPGDVLVVDACGGSAHAIIGGLMARYASHRGIAGIVVDGAVRDVEDLNALGLPVFARGLNPNGPYKDGPGEINTPIGCGGEAVLPGDLILGDADGVVVVPQGDAESVERDADALRRHEDTVPEAITGDRWDRAWITEKLTENGCEHV